MKKIGDCPCFILVTGATGFVGGRLVRALAQRGASCRCLVRSTSRRDVLGDVAGIEFVEGDLTDAPTLKGVARGVDAVFHLAAEGHVSATSEEAFRRFVAVNVDGTRNLLNECVGTPIRRFVHFSSTAAMGLIRKPLVDETDTPAPRTPYQKSKLESERVALSFWSEHKTPVVVLRPCMIYGAGTTAGEFVKMCRLMRKGMFPRVGFGRNLTPIVHVRDVVSAALGAAERGTPGEVYLITSAQSYELAQLRQYVIEASGIRRPFLYVPAWAMYAAAWGAQTLAGLRGPPPVVTVRNIASTVWDREFSIEKARRELGYEPQVDIREGIHEMIRWLQSQRKS